MACLSWSQFKVVFLWLQGGKTADAHPPGLPLGHASAVPLHLLPLICRAPPRFCRLCSRLPRARWLITTLGSRGSVLLERAEAAESAPEVALDDLVGELLAEAQASAAEAARQQPAPVCVSASGVAIHAGGQASSGGPRALRLRRGEAETRRVLAAAAAAAAHAAAANADAGNATGYAMRSSDGSEGGGVAVAQGTTLAATVTASTAAQLPAVAVVDTTGAGDAFIGSILYGLATGMPVRRAVQLAAVVAACKCTALGPRPGLPRRHNLAPGLLA